MNIRGATSISTTQPTRQTGSAIGAKESSPISTFACPAIPAIKRLELVPISVTEPASVVACAIGSNTCRAGMPRVCCSSFIAGISIATIGVVLIVAESTPTGTISLRNAWVAVCTPESNFQVTRDTAPVWMTPFAITSIAATVMMPPLLRPAKSSLGVAIRANAATAMPQPRAKTGGTFPDAIATKVATTMNPAK